jgi:large subunit ribosomal protein L29
MKRVEQLTELRGLGVDDLKHRAQELDDQVFRLRIQKSMGQAESGNKMRPLRRELARVKTVLQEKTGGAKER